jgi:hypothetical protein
MPCEHYKDALIETAASGSAPSGELRAHLVECDSCRAAFDEEQSLFAAMDSSLHAAANNEVPPSLLPRVRAGLDEVAVANPRWSSSWFALTGAAMAAVVLFFAIGTRQNNLRTPPINSGANRPPVSSIVPSTGSALSAGPSEKAGSVSQRKVFAAKNSALPTELAGQGSTPEILVPRDQDLLVAGYVQQWSSRKHSPLVARDVDESSVAPLEVAPIQITELGVKLLAESNSQ